MILALDLYLRQNTVRTNQNHPDIRALSKLLNGLPIHADRPDVARFRNPNGVYMKLCNFLRFDPTYKELASGPVGSWKSRFGRSSHTTESD